MHRFNHVGREFPDSLVDLVDAAAFGPQHRIAILENREPHFCSCINAGRLVTPASLSASITLMIVPKEDFLSACKARDDFRVGGRSRTALSRSSTPIVRP